MKRPGLTELRQLVASGEIDGIICTWYDRLTRSRDFYILDNEFKSHGVEFYTLHDPTDTTTAAGRFMECMLVAAKTYEREQTGEKVRNKMRMRLEKGMHQGGIVPFGFKMDAETKILTPDPEKVSTLDQLFQVYVETRSDFAVRDWLKAHQIPAPHGSAIRAIGSISDLLSNRRYIGEIEINRGSKGIEGVSEADAYRMVPAPYEPIVPRKLFEMAQAIRQEKAAESPNRRGRPRSFSQNQCQRVFLLQSRLTCAVCGHAMTPYYISHKPGPGRRSASYVYYYICARQHIKGRAACGHSNRVLAHQSESWVIGAVAKIAKEKGLIEGVIEAANKKLLSNLQPQRDALTAVEEALRKNQEQIEKIVDTITTGQTDGALLKFLNEKAATLNLERQQLRAEQRRLNEALAPTIAEFDTAALQSKLTDFAAASRVAEPQELQRLICFLVRKVEWSPDGNHRIELYPLRKKRGSNPVPPLSALENRLESNVWSGGPDRIRTGDLLRDRQAR